MADIIVAVACNLVATLILVSGLFSALHSGVKVSLVKFIMSLCGGVGAYFLTPMFSDKIYNIEGMSLVLEGRISHNTINSCIFLLCFLLFYAFTLIVCNIIRHCSIKKLRDKKLNVLKMKRAKSINPKAEKAAKRAEWKSLKAKYAEKRKWYHKLLSGFIGTVLAIIVGYITLLPFGYVVKDMEKDYLTQGYEYTLNGLIGENVSDFLIHAEEEIPEIEEEAPSIEVPGEGE